MGDRGRSQRRRSERVGADGLGGRRGSPEPLGVGRAVGSRGVLDTRESRPEGVWLERGTENRGARRGSEWAARQRRYGNGGESDRTEGTRPDNSGTIKKFSVVPPPGKEVLQKGPGKTGPRPWNHEGLRRVLVITDTPQTAEGPRGPPRPTTLLSSTPPLLRPKTIRLGPPPRPHTWTPSPTPQSQTCRSRSHPTDPSGFL